MVQICLEICFYHKTNGRLICCWKVHIDKIEIIMCGVFKYLEIQESVFIVLGASKNNNSLLFLCYLSLFIIASVTIPPRQSFLEKLMSALLDCFSFAWISELVSDALWSVRTQATAPLGCRTLPDTGRWWSSHHMPLPPCPCRTPVLCLCRRWK